MPDLIAVFTRWRKFIIAVTLGATFIAFIISLVVPQEYRATATALPANSLIADKSRIFNKQIEALYSDIGTADELDKIEGTAELDTIYIAAARAFQLDQHYGIRPSGESVFKAARRLKKNSDVSKSGYGELKICVWDRDRNLAAALANTLFQDLQLLHQQVQSENNRIILQQLTEACNSKRAQYIALTDSIPQLRGASAELAQAQKAALLQQLQDDEQLMEQYQLAVKTNPPVLIPVEMARPPLWPDKPRILSIVLFTLFGTLVVSFLVAIYLESRNSKA
jgi:Chain length determinant protein